MMTVALAIEKTILSNLPDVENHSGLSTNRRYLIGALGELAFEELLKREKKQFVYEPRTDGKSDDGDFDLVYGRLKITADVKTGSHKNIKYMYVTKASLKRKKYPMYIGCRIDKEKGHVEIWGYAKIDDMRDVPSKIPSIGKEFNLLTPIETLLKKLKGVEDEVVSLL